MNTFDFYRKRDFGKYFSDTFSFIRIYFVNFIKNYLIINGAVILTLLVTFFLLFGTNFDSFVQSLRFGSIDSLISIIVFFFVAIIGGLFIYGYPIAYALIAEKNQDRTNFTSSEIMPLLKSIIGRLILFGLLSIFFIGIPLVIIFFLLGTILVAGFKDSYALIAFSIFIGFFLILFALIIFFVWSNQAALLYIKDKEAYFASLSKAWKITFEDFKHKIGATIVMYILTWFISISGSLILSITSIISSLGVESSDAIEIIIFAIYSLVMIVLYFITSNLQFFLQLMIHFSSKHSQKTYTDIDQIGKNVDE